MIEEILLGITTSTASSVLKSVVGQDAANDLIEKGVSNLDASLQEKIARKRRQRAYESIAHLAADQLEAYLGIEFPDVSSGEVQGVVEDVKATFPNYDETRRMAVEASFDETRFVAQLSTRAPAWRNLEGNTTNNRLYQFLLNQTAVMYLRMLESFPDIQYDVNRQLLIRDDEVLESLSILQDAVEKIGQEITQRGWASTDDNDKFRIDYLNYVERRFRNIQLYGVEAHATKKQNLSVAYISLTVSNENRYRQPDKQLITNDTDEDAHTVFRPSSEEDGEPSEDLKVESALAGSDRVLVIGGAGIGKTTLLQWISLQAAGNKFTGQLEEWNGLTPFMVQLRKYAKKALPKPSEFVTDFYTHIAELCPKGWVENQLSTGHSVVLLDGLDELPVDQRPKALEWFSELVETYPSCKYIVTSRPNSSLSEWRRVQGFRVTELMPMQRSDLMSFVDHWHEAMALDLRDEMQIQEIQRLSHRLRVSIDNSPELKQLCSTPLLCALVCALHHSGNGHLPKSKMDLYHTAIKMLVSTRDQQRDISSHAGLNWDQSFEILRRTALWMHENELTAVGVPEFEDRIARISVSLGGLESLPAELGQYLRERSGVLREPVLGEIDFVHKSFLEYLAASAIIESDEVGKLIANSEKESWSEVIRWSAGHANDPQREILINGLIDRADDNPEARHRLFILAVACRNMARTKPLEDATIRRVEMCLNAVIPPHNMTDAAEIAAAGDVAVELLKKQSEVRRQARENAASVRALSLIGSEQSMLAIREFARDRRKTVNKEVYRAWSNYEARDFANLVLKDAVYVLANFEINDLAQAECLSDLPQVKNVSLNLGSEWFKANLNKPVRGVLSVVSYARQGLSSLDQLRAFPDLEMIIVQNSNLISDLRGIRNFSQLRELTLRSCHALSDISDLRNASAELRFIDLIGVRVSDYSPLGGGRYHKVNLGEVNTSTPPPKNFFASKLSVRVGSEELDLRRWLADGHVEKLSISRYSRKRDDYFISLPASCTDVSLHTELVPHVSEAQDVRELSLLDFAFNDDGIYDFPDLTAFVSLEKVDLRYVFIPRNISKLSELTTAKVVIIGLIGKAKDVDTVPEVPGFATTRLWSDIIQFERL